MSFVSRGFRGRRREDADPARVPPGQYVTGDFPVLSAGPTPHTPLDEWTFSIPGEVDEPRRWTWEEFRALPERRRHRRHPLRHQVVEARHHLDGRLRRHAARRGRDERGIRHRMSATAATRRTFPLEDVTRGKAWVAYAYDDEPLDPEHGGPARLLVPHLYFWKSAKWVRGLELREDDEPGFWEGYGYHNYGDPWREQRYWGD